MFSLDERLSLCASFVRHGSKLADIGTDHAYLPIWLIENNLIESAVAADVRTGPLENARNNIRQLESRNKLKDPDAPAANAQAVAKIEPKRLTVKKPQ